MKIIDCKCPKCGKESAGFADNEGTVPLKCWTCTTVKTFEMNGKAYQTDDETLELLRDIIPQAKRAGDFSAVMLVMDLGEHTGRIKEMTF